MAHLTVAEFEEAIRRFDKESVHLELRDSYGTEVELPHMAAWAAGEPDDLEWMQPWCDDLRRFSAEGKTVRRAHVVSEPLSVRRHVNRVSVEAAFFKELSPWENMLYAARLYGSGGGATRKRVQAY